MPVSSASDKTAKITLTFVKDELVVEVSDQGPGIEKKDLNNVFEPFFRTDATSKIKGYGIGLSLSHRILSIHKGRVELRIFSRKRHRGESGIGCLKVILISF